MADIPAWNPSEKARDKGPRRTTPPKAKTKRGKPGDFKLTADELEERINGFIEGLGGTMQGFGGGGVLSQDGVVLIASSEELAASHRRLAELNPYYRKALDTFLSGGETLKMLTPTIVVVLAIARNHGAPAAPFLPPQETFQVRAFRKIKDAMDEELEDLTPEDLAEMQRMMGSNGNGNGFTARPHHHGDSSA